MSEKNPRRRQRRRVVRYSDAPNIDRSVDRPDRRFNTESTPDSLREVVFDPQDEDTPEGDAFWDEQRPPHYG
ncbi:hypothetical protein [Corynebacterium alimapuense]|uniref:Uncharacterized protein n=1 Tax=Corynebacterium alimapuense TaxID=1576874 RepID=A0A3M8K5U7_9CORY|nr:hypothetical protein [Corynebacterium alimapuense]RNE48603.1 hypothetical protein C5L39_08940 [Corynebacterium alimapuense]